jgi:hypothetical protein
MRQYNLPLLQKVRTVGRYDMPMLAKQDVTTPDTLMGFNYATGKKTVKHCGIHFFIDDYQLQSSIAESISSSMTTSSRESGTSRTDTSHRSNASSVC